MEEGLVSSSTNSPFRRPIGIFDSGVGGLSVLRHIRTLLPQESLVYFADQAHVPYGPRSQEEIRQFSDAISRLLLRQGAKLIVVACNTASGAALTHLRRVFPEIPFVGMEPAVKPAAAVTKTGKVGVLATTGTFESQRYVELMRRWGHGVQVLQSPCHGLVEKIETGELDTLSTEQLVRSCLEPMLAAGVDTLVLGCTHYPFVIPFIKRNVGNAVSIIDPAPAVARQTQRMLRQHGLMAPSGMNGTVSAFTSGDVDSFAALASRLLAYPVETKAAIWLGDHLSAG